MDKYTFGTTRNFLTSQIRKAKAVIQLHERKKKVNGTEVFALSAEKRLPSNDLKELEKNMNDLIQQRENLKKMFRMQNIIQLKNQISFSLDEVRSKTIRKKDLDGNEIEVMELSPIQKSLASIADKQPISIYDLATQDTKKKK